MALVGHGAVCRDREDAAGLQAALGDGRVEGADRAALGVEELGLHAGVAQVDACNESEERALDRGNGEAVTVDLAAPARRRYVRERHLDPAVAGATVGAGLRDIERGHRAEHGGGGDNDGESRAGELSLRHESLERTRDSGENRHREPHG